MRHVKFEIVTNDETGEGGIVPLIFKNWESYMPVMGFGFAHDLLEHTTKETGEVYQELKALGALLYVREFGTAQGQRGYGDIRHPSVRMGESFAYELTTIWRFVNEFDLTQTLPEISPRKFRGELEDKMKLLFHTLRLKIKDAWDSENNYDEGEDSEFYYNVCPYADKMELIEAWIREGYHLARKRYKGEYVYHVREAIIREVDRKWNSLQEFCDTGEEFTISYNLDGHCKITDCNYYL